MIKKIWDAIRADDVGGEVQMDASVLTEGAGEDNIEVHCWDGRRYNLTLTRLANGCKYDMQSGEPIVEEGKPQIVTKRDALVALIESMNHALNAAPSNELDDLLTEKDVNDLLDVIECFKPD
jgi:hypothetical protein